METNTSEIRDRIKIVMNHEGKNSITFSEEIGIQQSTLSHILNGRNRPSLDVVMKIHERYPDISFDWLINGTGEMQVESSTAADEQETMVNRSSGSYNNGVDMPSITSSESAPFVVGASKARSGMSDLFEQGIPLSQQQPPSASASPSYQHQPIASTIPPQEVIKYVERPCKKITEIIIYYDDNTWEKFTCGK